MASKRQKMQESTKNNSKILESFRLPKREKDRADFEFTKKKKEIKLKTSSSQVRIRARRKFEKTKNLISREKNKKPYTIHSQSHENSKEMEIFHYWLTADCG